MSAGPPWPRRAELDGRELPQGPPPAPGDHCAALASCFVYRCASLRQSVGEGPLRSFNGKPRDECLGGEIFYSLKERAVVIEQWRNDYGPIGRIHR
ncbi:hypothetical protein E0H22_02710 [Rhodopseudomonas boonkerdii]|nr:hypothetical protein E0H22_02710 [Rhodopseudomonas boonkerdii]